MMRTLILNNSFVYEILMTSREKYNISFLRDEGVTVVGLASPMQFQDKIFIGVREA